MSKETFQEYLEEKLKEMKEEKFQPNAWFNEDGDFLEVDWDDSRSYGEQTKNGRMTIMRSIETEEIVGVKVYGIRKLMSMEE